MRPVQGTATLAARFNNTPAAEDGVVTSERDDIMVDAVVTSERDDIMLRRGAPGACAVGAIAVRRAY